MSAKTRVNSQPNRGLCWILSARCQMSVSSAAVVSLNRARTFSSRWLSRVRFSTKIATRAPTTAPIRPPSRDCNQVWPVFDPKISASCMVILYETAAGAGIRHSTQCTPPGSSLTSQSDGTSHKQSYRNSSQKTATTCDGLSRTIPIRLPDVSKSVLFDTPNPATLA